MQYSTNNCKKQQRGKKKTNTRNHGTKLNRLVGELEERLKEKPTRKHVEQR